mgnify:CR=1 FL=1
MNQRAAAIIIKEGKILLIHRIKNGKQYFVFPGGGVEKGERTEETVMREVKEELNLDVLNIEKLLFQIKNQGRKELYFLIKDFSGIVEFGGEEKEIMNENNQYYPVWISFEEMKKLKNLYPEEAKEKAIKLLGI